MYGQAARLGQNGGKGGRLNERIQQKPQFFPFLGPKDIGGHARRVKFALLQASKQVLTDNSREPPALVADPLFSQLLLLRHDPQTERHEKHARYDDRVQEEDRMSRGHASRPRPL